MTTTPVLSHILLILSAHLPQMYHLRNLVNWQVHPLSNRVTCLHEISCMVELIHVHNLFLMEIMSNN